MSKVVGTLTALDEMVSWIDPIGFAQFGSFALAFPISRHRNVNGMI